MTHTIMGAPEHCLQSLQWQASVRTGLFSVSLTAPQLHWAVVGGRSCGLYSAAARGVAVADMMLFLDNDSEQGLIVTTQKEPRRIMVSQK